jgi:multisubunit Na+/H+ antiporter MnhG subunit
MFNRVHPTSKVHILTKILFILNHHMCFCDVQFDLVVNLTKILVTNETMHFLFVNAIHLNRCR